MPTKAAPMVPSRSIAAEMSAGVGVGDAILDDREQHGEKCYRQQLHPSVLRTDLADEF